MRKRIIYLTLFLLFPVLGYGMHIAEGFLPPKWSIIWFIVYVPFLYYGLRSVKKTVGINMNAKLLFAVVAAFVFVLSSLKLPSVAGSSSHLTGIALGALLFGASSMSVIGLIVLLFQALLLAHGGLTTLGANAFSMSVAGAFVAIWVYSAAQKFKAPKSVSIFVAAFLSDLFVYIVTSFQLAVAFQNGWPSFLSNLVKFLSVFAVTQLPLAIVEGVITVFAFRLILKYNKADISIINPKLDV